MESQRVGHDLATEQQLQRTLHSPSKSFSSQVVQTQSPYHSPASPPTMSPAPAGSSIPAHSIVLPSVTMFRTQQYPQPWAWALAGSSNTVSDSTVISGQTSHQRRLPLSQQVLTLCSSHLSPLCFHSTSLYHLSPPGQNVGSLRARPFPGLFLTVSSTYRTAPGPEKESENTWRINQLFSHAFVHISFTYNSFKWISNKNYCIAQGTLLHIL